MAIIQCYRGNMKEGGATPLSILDMNFKYAKLQVFDIVFPTLDIPTKVKKVVSKPNPLVAEAKAKLDDLIKKDKNLKSLKEKQELSIKKTQEEIELLNSNINAFNGKVAELRKKINIDVNTEYMPPIERASHESKKDKILSLEQEKKDSIVFLRTLRVKLQNIEDEFEQICQDEEDNNKLKEEQVNIIGDNEIKLEGLTIQPTILNIFKYEGDGRILSITNHSYRKKSEAPQSHGLYGEHSLIMKGDNTRCNMQYALELRSNNAINFIYRAEKCEIGKGDILQISLIIGV